MKGGYGPTKQLQDLNWGAFDHASHAPQLRSCSYFMHTLHVHVRVYVTMGGIMYFIQRRGLTCGHVCDGDADGDDRESSTGTQR